MSRIYKGLNIIAHISGNILYSLSEVKTRGVRHNDVANRRHMFFASKLSVYFSWVFINLGLSANLVTFMFFLCGLIGAFLLFVFDPAFAVLSYILFRLHIVIDVSDGEVARFNQTYSLNGAYWDFMIHVVLYPLYFIAMSFALYSHFGNEQFLIIGMLGSMAISLYLAVKNTFYRALFVNNRSYSEERDSGAAPVKATFKFYLFTTLALATSFEGFFIAYVLGVLVAFNEAYFLIMLPLFSIFFLLNGFVKFLLLSKTGSYPKRN